MGGGPQEINFQPFRLTDVLLFFLQIFNGGKQAGIQLIDAGGQLANLVLRMHHAGCSLIQLFHLFRCNRNLLDRPRHGSGKQQGTPSGNDGAAKQGYRQCFSDSGFYQNTSIHITLNNGSFHKTVGAYGHLRRKHIEKNMSHHGDKQHYQKGV